MKYTIRHTKDVSFNTLEEAEKYRSNQSQDDVMTLIVNHFDDSSDPFGDRWNINPSSAIPKDEK